MKKVSSRRPSGKKSFASQKKVVYRVKNWLAYDQALVQRGSLTVWLSEEALDSWGYAGPTQRGAQFVYADLAIETALTFRKLFRLPLRQTEGFVQSLLGMMALPLNAPDHTTLSRRQKGLAVNLPVQPSDRPRPWPATTTPEKSKSRPVRRRTRAKSPACRAWRTSDER